LFCDELEDKELLPLGSPLLEVNGMIVDGVKPDPVAATSVPPEIQLHWIAQIEWILD